MSAALAFRAGTLAFWLAVLALWWAAPPIGDAPSVPIDDVPPGPISEVPSAPAGEAGAPAPAASTATFTLAEVAAHARADDCWMAIAGEVYDITAYVERHRSEPELLLPWCGREATEAYRTKTRGRPHSARADGLLVQYRIGTLRGP